MNPTFIQSLLNTTTTLNGAASHVSSLSKSLDLFSLGATSNNSDKEHLILEALCEDPVTAIKVVFYLRDCRAT